MFYRSFHRLVFPLVLITVVGSVWVAGWSQAIQAEAQRGTWPALPVRHPVNCPSNTGNQSSEGRSLQQVLLEHDQVVGVR